LATSSYDRLNLYTLQLGHGVELGVGVVVGVRLKLKVGVGELVVDGVLVLVGVTVGVLVFVGVFEGVFEGIGVTDGVGVIGNPLKQICLCSKVKLVISLDTHGLHIQILMVSPGPMFLDESNPLQLTYLNS
jgi:hypothetical protein